MTNHDDRDVPAHRQSSHHDSDDVYSRVGPPSDATSHQDLALPDVAKLPFVPPVVTTTHLQDHHTTGGVAAHQGGPTEETPAAASPTGDDRGTPLHSRREVIRRGSKLAFTAPIISTFYASQAYASNYSCYGEGHACGGAEPCCGDLSCNGGVCSEFCVDTGDPCFTDADCCSADCRVGSCQ